MKKCISVAVAVLLLFLWNTGLSERTAETNVSLIDVYGRLTVESHYDTGYSAAIDDSAGLLQDDELRSVMPNLLSIAQYCNIGFMTYPESGPSELPVLTKASLWGKLVFNDNEPYTVFIIDMKTRNLGIYMSWDSEQLWPEKIDEILDGTYTYASSGEYCQCTNRTLRMILAAFENQAE